MIFRAVGLCNVVEALIEFLFLGSCVHFVQVCPNNDDRGVGGLCLGLGGGEGEGEGNVHGRCVGCVRICRICEGV